MTKFDYKRLSPGYLILCLCLFSFFSGTLFAQGSLPLGWSDSDIGNVGVSGSAGYTSNVFTVQGGGGSFFSVTADAFHFAYVPLSGDGAITARVTGGNTSGNVGVMIRETLAATSNHMFMDVYAGSSLYEAYRASGGSSSYTYVGGGTVPIWVRVVRSGSTFTGYTSSDGENWKQAGTSQTITMAQNVYMGLAVAGNISTANTATFDNVSFTSTASPAITAVSATTGPVGSQVVIYGSFFGDSQGSSVVLLHGTAVTVNSWNDASITITIPNGATSGDLAVSVAPSMNDSNPVYFTVTGNPLPPGWLDEDIGQVGLVGGAGYATSVFTVQGGGSSFFSVTADAFHFAYVPLSGDGAITARVTGGNTSGNVGVMIRETLAATSNHMFMDVYAGSYLYEAYRASGGSSSYTYVGGGTVPIWVRVVRSGSTFTGYTSSDGENWKQAGTSQTITMAQNVYMGLAVAGNTSTANTATFDNVSFTSTASPAPAISAVSATTGPAGSQIVVSGSGFGASQGASVVLLHGTAVTVNSWNDASITITIPSGATSGDLVVSVAPTMNESNPVYFTVTGNPLPPGWLDEDIGQVGLAGGAGYATSVFTVQGGGSSFFSVTADAFHFAYVPLSGDGAITARVTGGNTSGNVGVMIRETLAATSNHMFMDVYAGSYLYEAYRASGGSSSYTYVGGGNGPDLGEGGTKRLHVHRL